MAIITVVGTATALVVGLLALRLVVSYLSYPLKAFPGPFLAKFTNLWRLFDYWGHTQIQSHQKLHEKFGPAVRIGPNMVSLSDPGLLKVVYSIRPDYVKSDFYEVGDAVSNGMRFSNVFSTRNNEFHGKLLKSYQKYFSSTAIMSKEPLTDKAIISLCQQLEERFVNGKNAGKTCDLAEWIEFCAWDLDWELTFGRDMGFLKSGADVKGLVQTGESVMRYLGIVGQMPYLDRLLGKNKYCPIKFDTFEHAATYSFQQLMERQASQDAKSKDDFMGNFLEAQEQKPDVVTNQVIISYLMMNVLAGADTVAIVQKAIVYYILANTSVHAKVRAELNAANVSNPARYDEVKDLPYLAAVIREGRRMHPVIGGILERIVPASGLTLPDGRTIAPGTKVGINAWVSSRNRAIYGDEPDVFRPERWLREQGEAEADYDERLKAMKEADFTFGSGRRVCVGRHLAVMELYKFTATLFSRYDISLDTTAKPWKRRFWWLVFIDDINVKIRRRATVPAIPSGETAI